MSENAIFGFTCCPFYQTLRKRTATAGVLRLKQRLLTCLLSESAKLCRRACPQLLTEDAILDWVRNRLFTARPQVLATGAYRTIRVGTDFSGLETPSLALATIEPNINFKLEFICEQDPALRAFAVAAHRPSVALEDVMSRDVGAMPKVDLYIAGAPCQAWSRAGRMAGIGDEAGRGHLWARSLDYVQEKNPTVVILENVPELVTSFSAEFRHVVDALKSSWYKTKYNILCTSDHDIPQHRRRAYAVAIKENALQEKFRFPKKVGWTINFGALLHTGKWGVGHPRKTTLSARGQMIVNNATRKAVKDWPGLAWLGR